MAKIGLYINSDISNLELKQYVYSSFAKTENNFYTNLEVNGLFHFENKAVYSQNIRENCRVLLMDLAKEYYNNFSDTVLFNDKFNFWHHLRFNSFLHLLNFYKIKVWIDELKKQKQIEKLIVVNVNTNTHNLLSYFYPETIFISIPKPKVENKNSKIFFLMKFANILRSGSSILFKKINSPSKTLIFSLKGSIMPILTENGIQVEDKFMYYIKNNLTKNDYSTLLNSNIYSKKGIESYKKDKLSNDFDFTNENLLCLLFFNLKFIKEIFKTFYFFKNLKKQKNSLLNIIVLNNKNGLFSELISYHSFYNFLQKSNFKNTILIGEMNPTLNSIVRASKQLGIHCIGIQHGLLNEENIGYNFSKFELEKDNPFPNKLIVWGQDEQLFLDTNKSILKNTVQAKGNIIFDGIKFLKKEKSNHKFTILYASQPQPILEHRMKSINDFVNAIVKLNKKEIKVIVRLHPGEFTNYNLYLDAFKKLEPYDFELDKGKEIITQLDKMDVLVTSYSTVSKDALILNKPVILQDYNNEDLTGLLSKNVAFNAKNSNDLFQLLTQIKNNEISISKENFDAVNSKMFAKTNLRVAEEVIKLLN